MDQLRAPYPQQQPGHSCSVQRPTPHPALSLRERVLRGSRIYWVWQERGSAARPYRSGPAT